MAEQNGWMLAPAVTAARTPSTGEKGSGRDVVTLRLHHPEHPGGGFGDGHWPPAPTSEVADAYRAAADRFRKGEEWAAVLRCRAALATAEKDHQDAVQAAEAAVWAAEAAVWAAEADWLDDAILKGRKAADWPKLEGAVLTARNRLEMVGERKARLQRIEGKATDTARAAWTAQVNELTAALHSRLSAEMQAALAKAGAAVAQVTTDALTRAATLGLLLAADGVGVRPPASLAGWRVIDAQVTKHEGKGQQGND